MGRDLAQQMKMQKEKLICIPKITKSVPYFNLILADGNF